MPPKKPPPTTQKQKAKIVEDKTFGLKNKNKSKKVSSYVEQVKNQVNSANGKKKPEDDPKAKAAAKKAEDDARKAELALLYKPIQATQKAPPGVDPKSLVCEFFKAGSCTKGNKCKFSHDISIERKAAKIDIYTDMRDEEKKDDTMDNWDQDKLEQVVKSKGVGKKPQSEIICKYFLDVLEKNQYGWFWECPNGDTCHYRHALPPGFVLKKDAKKKKDDEGVTLEEYIETERAKIKGQLTPVNEETFAEWKTKRLEKKKQDEEEKRKTKEAAVKAGKSFNLSGRDLFTYRPDLFVDDEEAVDADMYGNHGSDAEYSDEEGATQGIEGDDDEEDADYGRVGTSASHEADDGIEESLFTDDLENLDIDDEGEEGDEEGDGDDDEGDEK